MTSVGRVFVVTILVLAGAGVAGLAASKAGLLDRLDSRYAAWSLESRVEGHWDARVAGDREAAMQGAVSTACAVLSSGVTSGMACDRTPPRSARCTE